jgi:hypothetical protein
MYLTNPGYIFKIHIVIISLVPSKPFFNLLNIFLQNFQNLKLSSKAIFFIWHTWYFRLKFFFYPGSKFQNFTDVGISHVLGGILVANFNVILKAKILKLKILFQNFVIFISVNDFSRWLMILFSSKFSTHLLSFPLSHFSHEPYHTFISCILQCISWTLIMFSPILHSPSLSFLFLFYFIQN